MLALQFLVNDAGFIYYALFNHPISCNFLAHVHQSIISCIQCLYEIESAIDMPWETISRWKVNPSDLKLKGGVACRPLPFGSEADNDLQTLS